MTGADVPPVGAEAREAAFSVWYQAHVQPGAGDPVANDEAVHAAWDAGWAEALQWAAQLADKVGASYLTAEWSDEDGHYAAPSLFVSLLRGEGGGT